MRCSGTATVRHGVFSYLGCHLEMSGERDLVLVQIKSAGQLLVLQKLYLVAPKKLIGSKYRTVAGSLNMELMRLQSRERTNNGQEGIQRQ